MTWIVTVPGGRKVESDEFTLAQLGQAEKESDVPWSIQNPLRSAVVAKAYLRIALEIAGQNPSDADTLTLKAIKSMFDYREDQPLGDEQAAEVGETIPLDRSSRVSSRGPAAPTTGPRKKRAASA